MEVKDGIGDTSPAVEVSSLVKRYGELVAVDGLSLRIPRGQVLGLLGPNGSGKTTTISCLLQLLTYDKGSIRVFGEPMTPTAYGLKRRIGVVPQEVAVFDEPTVAVDPQSRNAILDGIKRLNEHGATILYTSHYMEEVEQLCDRIVIMDRGQQVASGTSDELKAMIGTGERIRVKIAGPVPLGEEALEALRRLEHVRTVTYQDGEVLVECTSGAHNLSDVMRALNAAGATCGRVTSEPPTLNDVFLEITGRALRDEAA